jgi:hypothetical protein
MAREIDVKFRIALLGPTLVGKTSLVTALLAESQGLLAGSGVAMRTVGAATEDKIANNRRELEGDLLAGEFRPGSLTGTVEPFLFRLKLDPGVEDSEINLELLDFPGAWLSAGRPEAHGSDWEECKRFITTSTALLVPVDAAVLMEAAKAEHKRAIPYLLTTFEVEQVARDWAIERNRRPEEPALIAFCPVKCESYFTDNGGRRDRSAQLLKVFRDVYGGVLDAVHSDAPKATILYSPVDTIGCVEIVDAEWSGEGRGRQEFRAKYRIRQPPRIQRVGVDNVMRAVCRQLVAGRRIVSAEEGEQLVGRAEQARSYADRREGLIRDMWLLISRERQARRRMAQTSSREAEEAWRRVAALDTVIEQIAAVGYGPRAHVL